MNIIEVKQRDEKLIQDLLNVWESSVRATHLFLSNDEINQIKQYVQEALKNIPILLVSQ